LQLAGPVSVGARSDGLNASCSDIYLEKVTEKVVRWLEDKQVNENENSLSASNSILDAISLESTEMYDQIVQGRVEPSLDAGAVHFMTKEHITLTGSLPSPTSLTSKDSCVFLPAELVEPVQSMRRIDIKKRLYSTDSGVELNSNLATKNTLSDIQERSSDGLSLFSNANSNVLHSTEHNQEIFNEMMVTCMTPRVGDYIRPEKIEWEDKYVGHCSEVTDDKSCKYVESISSDSGHEDKVSDEAISGSRKTEEEDMEFNNDGYVTSPVSCDSGHDDKVIAELCKTYEGMEFNHNGYVTSPVLIGQ